MSYSVSDVQEGRLFDWSELINIGHALGHKWWMIGTKLRVPEDVLDQIAANNSEVGDCGACLLREWLAHDPIWSELITILETPAVGLNEVAGNIRMKLVREASKEQLGNKITARHSSANTTRNHWEPPLENGEYDIQTKLEECSIKCQGFLDSHDWAQWEMGIEESSRGIDMCRDNPGVSNSNEVAMTLHLMRAKLMWKLVTMKQSKEVSKWHQLEKCLLDCEEVIHMARCDMKYASTEYEGISLAYQCGLVKGDDRVIQQYRRNLLQQGTSRADMLQLERAAFEGAGSRSYKTRMYHLQEMLFPKVSFIEQPLLDDVIRCYKERQTVCRNCFYNDLKLSRGFNAKGQCTRCQWEFKKLLVIPKSPMTVNYYKSEMIAIPPWPKSKPNELPFESCAKPTDKSQEHKRCLVMSRNSAVWYAHTVEELVIWTVEREYNCTFEEFIQQRGMPFTPYMPPMQPPPPPHPHVIRQMQPSFNSTNQVAPQQPHPPVGSKPPVVSNRPFTQNRLGQAVNHNSNSWSPWSNDLEFLSPPTSNHTTGNTSPLKQIWSHPDGTNLDALQSSFNTMSLDAPSSRSHDASWDVSLPPSNGTKWSDGWSNGMDAYSAISHQLTSYHNGTSSSRLSRPLPNGSTLLARGVNSDVKALSRPRSALYHPSHVTFSSVASIPKELLQSVCICYSRRHRVCQTCFISTSPTTKNDLLKISRQNGPCYKCGQSILPILVMPTSSLCVNYTTFIPILPCPANATCIKCCPNAATCHDQECCYAHSVEELVIWCVELESGGTFEEVYDKYLPENDNSNHRLGRAPVKRYTLASVTFKNQNDVPRDLLYQVLRCHQVRSTVCKACFYKFRPQTEVQLKSFQPVQVQHRLVCGSCGQSFSGLLVMPSCSQCENNYGNFIPIANRQNSPVHSVEEMVLRLVDSKISVDIFNNI